MLLQFIISTHRNFFAAIGGKGHIILLQDTVEGSPRNIFGIFRRLLSFHFCKERRGRISYNYQKYCFHVEKFIFAPGSSTVNHQAQTLLGVGIMPIFNRKNVASLLNTIYLGR